MYLHCYPIVVEVARQRFLGESLHEVSGETLKHPARADLCRKTAGEVQKYVNTFMIIII